MGGGLRRRRTLVLNHAQIGAMDEKPFLDNNVKASENVIAATKRSDPACRPHQFVGRQFGGARLLHRVEEGAGEARGAKRAPRVSCCARH